MLVTPLKEKYGYDLAAKVAKKVVKPTLKERVGALEKKAVVLDERVTIVEKRVTKLENPPTPAPPSPPSHPVPGVPPEALLPVCVVQAPSPPPPLVVPEPFPPAPPMSPGRSAPTSKTKTSGKSYFPLEVRLPKTASFNPSQIASSHFSGEPQPLWAPITASGTPSSEL